MPVPDDVRAFLHELGASDDEVDAAERISRLPGLASDLVLDRDATLTPEDMAAAVPGLDTAFVVEAYRLLGITVRPGERVLSDADAALMRLVVEPLFPVVLSGGDDMLRVVATSMSRIADAVVSMYVQQVEPTLAATDGDPVISIDWVRTNAESSELGLAFGNALGTLFRHHLRGAIRRQRASQEGMTERALARFAVGFVDLVGFTPLSRSLATSDLVELVRRFETTAFDVAAAHGGWVVKHIGDEIMFTALDADAGAQIALALVGSFGEDIHPRGAMAWGEVLTVHGDYYGSVVNLASRLADGAVPGEILVDSTTNDALTEVPAAPAGRRMLKGFDEPVTVFSLVG